MIERERERERESEKSVLAAWLDDDGDDDIYLLFDLLFFADYIL